MLLYLIKKDKINVIIGFVTLCLFALNKSILSLVILYDISVANKTESMMFTQFILVNASYLFYYFTSSYFSEFFLDKFMTNSRDVLNKEIYKQLISKNNHASASDYGIIFTNDIPLICETFIQGVINILYFAISFISAAFIIGNINLYMLVYLVVISISSLVVLKQIVRSLSKKQTQFNESVSSILKKVNEAIPNLKQIKIFNMSNKFEIDFGLISRESSDKLFAITFSEDLVEVINQSTSTLIQVGMYVLSVFLVLNGQMVIGSIIAIVASAEAITLPVYSFSRVISKFKKTEEIRLKLMNIINSNNNPKTEKRELQTINSIELCNYSSLIEQKPINKNISYKTTSGKKIAIVGDNGSGKSTLINILTCSDYSYSGQILINDCELKNIDESSLLTKVSYVSQNVVLFEDTIKNNIILQSSFNKTKYNDILSMLALEKLDDNLLITENQANLSGGEKQKIMIARALYKDSDLLLFDEPLSALDQSSREKLIQYLTNVEKRMLLIVIHGGDKKNLQEFDGILKLEIA